ncbi:iodotyrosine deiodinase 1-like [Bradysia coprophila]|uniref:iodotyrosine deiodinase 1-like n=1 Tax=Bradysia coprophila TaxID=38358 RepID=UPI00187DC695|nr:iodotyrosine deiodinase 1-like [Bradysia coprophila]
MYIFIETLCSESKVFRYFLYILPILIFFVFKKLISKQLYAVRSRNKIRFQKEDIDDDDTVQMDSHHGPCSSGRNLTFDPIPFLPEVEHIPYCGLNESLDESGDQFYNLAKNRRSVRNFNREKPVDLAVIEKCILAAGTSPSGVGTQPWTYCVIRAADVKQQVRAIIEAEEYINYTQRMSPQLLTDLRPLQTNHLKPYLTDAPYLIIVFKQIYGHRPDGKRMPHYYNEISVSVSVGILVSALVCAGLSSVVTRPECVGLALKKLLKRPENERFLFVIAVGHSTDDCKVPCIESKPLQEIMVTY